MKHKVIGIIVLTLFLPLFAFANVGEDQKLALVTQSSSEVSTGGIQVGAGGSASSKSGSASVEITNTISSNKSGVVEVVIETQTDGVVKRESIQKKVSPGETLRVFVATSSNSVRASGGAQMSLGTSSEINVVSTTTSSWPRTQKLLPWLPELLNRLFNAFWFF